MCVCVCVCVVHVCVYVLCVCVCVECVCILTILRSFETLQRNNGFIVVEPMELMNITICYDIIDDIRWHHTLNCTS